MWWGRSQKQPLQERTEDRWGKLWNRLCPQTLPKLWREESRVGKFAQSTPSVWEESASGISRPEPQGLYSVGFLGARMRQADTLMANVLFSELCQADSGTDIGFWTFKRGWEWSLEEGDFSRGGGGSCRPFTVMAWHLFLWAAFCIFDSKAHKKAYCRKSSPIIINVHYIKQMKRVGEKRIRNLKSTNYKLWERPRIVGKGPIQCLAQPVSLTWPLSVPLSCLPSSTRRGAVLLSSLTTMVTLIQSVPCFRAAGLSQRKTAD